METERSSPVSTHRSELPACALTPAERRFALSGHQDAADTIRNMRPLLVRFGIATGEEIGGETLAARLREEVVRQRGTIMSPASVAAWTQDLSGEAASFKASAAQHEELTWRQSEEAAFEKCHASDVQ